MDACSISSDGCFPDLYNETIVKKCRKEHICVECDAVISPGSSYKYVSGVWDKQFQTFKICIDCASVHAAFGQAALGELYDELQETLCECDVDVEYAKLEALTPTALARVLGMMQEIIDDRELDE